MEKEKFFVMARINRESMWRIVSLLTEDYEEAKNEYERESKNRLYSDVKIGKTIYG
jgi:hypothetical protein